MALTLEQIEWLGYVAAVMTTAAFVPQAWLIIKTRDTRGISLAMYAIFTVGVAMWLCYGLALEAWPVILANSVTLGLAGCILLMKILGERELVRAEREAVVGTTD